MELLTLKAYELIKNTDVMIYADSLVSNDIEGLVKKSCIVYKSSRMTLNEVLNVIQRHYNDGLDICRVHSGDPSIYGAIDEQIKYFNEHSMEYEIIPGVSSVFAAASRIGELTRPGLSQSLIITRVPVRTDYIENEDLSELARHKSTMAILLSAARAREVTEKLINAGFSENDRLIIAYKISWPDEMIIETTVKDLEGDLFKNRISRQAIIFAGGVISFHGGKSSNLYNENFKHMFRAGKKS
ncbi:cobalt-precorrin-4/precorrin-4 C(11)-methyltransferase [Picrophilus oshimae]|uniref:Precorrin-4 C11-methyltransferase n=1 Tax=Picrophilus torridus (strain ATCC 700027 / DSM 9790 / JCM 10055 / NBRC 100828 / KAW 2/3) TaxID=1122961 RepID=Q6KZ35_PICTO|nr:cobalt-precorrin-4/precorrin-4 C(11)-methyltransferase [Picrophilus oshimae]AAT44017.1 precorrin-4 C11-methyltransferase [Picrophilus oshimae DSM 9789]SMD30912.1 precorrin-4 C11-methyltransferase [Picrophilus oshimae DSM 9789]